MKIQLTLWSFLATFLFTVAAHARELYSSTSGDTALTFKSSLKANWEMFPVVSGDSAADTFWRLRLEPEFKLNPEINFSLAWDMQSLLSTPSADSALLPRPMPDFYRIRPLGWTGGGQNLSSQQELDRAWAAYQPDFGNFTLGRQAIGWGRGVLFSAVDIFTPFSPLEPDREWRRGVDALRGDIKIMDGISLDLVAAAGSNPLVADSPATWDDSILAGRLRGNLGNWDAELVGGHRGLDSLAGCTASLPLGKSEIHGEAAIFAVPGDIPDSGMLGHSNWVPKAVLGGSNFFALGGGLTLALEYHYSGFGVADIQTLPDRLADPGYLYRFDRGDTQIPGRQAFALQATYSATDLVQAGLNVLQSATDNSGVLAPSLQWNFSDNVTLMATGLWGWGDKIAAGKPHSQFGDTPVSCLAQIRIYD